MAAIVFTWRFCSWRSFNPREKEYSEVAFHDEEEEEEEEEWKLS